MNILDKLISLYSKLTKRSITIIRNNKPNAHYIPNGSIVKSVKNDSENIRGSRSKYLNIYEDSNTDINTEDLEDILRKYKK